MPDRLINGRWQLEVAEALGRIEGKIDSTLSDHDRRLVLLEENRDEQSNIPTRVEQLEDDVRFHKRMQYVHTIVVVPILGVIHVFLRKMGMDV